MYLILSQNSEDHLEYKDEPFFVYHFPATYKSQIQEGDKFIYHRGHKSDRKSRFYFGAGTIDRIWTEDGVNYFASVKEGKKFSNLVPIHKGNSYFESINYQDVRRGQTPAWQRAIRPLSKEAYEEIIQNAGNLIDIMDKNVEYVQEKELLLKQAFRDYFLEKTQNSLVAIYESSRDLASHFGLLHFADEKDDIQKLYDFCSLSEITNSYEMVFVLGILSKGDENGEVSMPDMVSFFQDYFTERLIDEKPMEIHGLFSQLKWSSDSVLKSIEINAIIPLVEKGIVEVSGNRTYFTKSTKESDYSEEALIQMCKSRLDEYFADLQIMKTD